VLLSRANLPAQPDFREILKDRHRPPSQLADKLMRILTSDKRLFRQSAGISGHFLFLGRDFKGGSPLHGKLNFFSDATTVLVGPHLITVIR
jgi:hypothetical protein